MEIVNNIIQTTLDSFDFAYCIVVNILTYFVISTINSRRGHKDINTWTKRLVLLITILSTGVVYYLIGSDTRVLLNSAILAPVAWSWIFKPICKKLGLDYKQVDDTISK